MTCLRSIACVLGLAGLAMAAHAATGLQAPSSAALWPSLQARIAIQATAAPALGSSSLASGWASGTRAGSVQGGAVLGDFYFALPSFGGFRATSGVLVGAQAGAPQWMAGSGAQLGLVVNSTSFAAPTGGDGVAPLPYLGIGFTSQATSGGWSLSADLGMVAENSTSGSLRRALGVQGLENTRRELRLSPLLQVGWRYSF